ncbi:hypothetical protein [Citrobacter koseri]|uniref:hypothetical protein n=1 Tax=Citrobacter koseri TaxID=545 RepID=UPI0023B138E5|nr:hypothetical protein [Citrobacter koseri]
MKHPRDSRTSEVQIRTSDAFARMGVAMENLLAAAPKFLSDTSVDGSKECHGKRKVAKKAA